MVNSPKFKTIGRCKDPIKEKERREKISIAMKNIGFGGYRENAGHSKKFKVKDSNGNVVCSQSTYELKLSEILNELNVHWIRPKHFYYDLNGQKKRYYPDFFLSEHNLYIDTKNSYLATKDAEKIKLVKEQNLINLIVLTEQQINIDFINGRIIQK